MQTPKFLFALREDLKNNPEFLPTRADEQSTGWDVRAAMEDRKPLIIKPGEYCKVSLGFKCHCPEGWWYKLVPRSSSFFKKSLHFLYGVIDETFPLEACAVFQYLPTLKLETSTIPIYDHFSGNGNIDGPKYRSETVYNASNLKIEFGEAIGQIIPVKRQEMIVESISNEEIERLFKERNAVRIGGFGSSDGGYQHTNK